MNSGEEFGINYDVQLIYPCCSTLTGLMTSSEDAELPVRILCDEVIIGFNKVDFVRYT